MAEPKLSESSIEFIELSFPFSEKYFEALEVPPTTFFVCGVCGRQFDYLSHDLKSGSLYIKRLNMSIRDTSRGDTNDLILLTRDLQRQLEGRREANVKVSKS